MNTFLHDLATGAQVSHTYAGTIASDTVTKGEVVDMQPTDGPVHGLVAVGAYGDGDTQTVVKLQESATTADGDFTDIVGALVTLAASATANDNTAHVIRANRTKRYMRAVATTSGGGSVSVALGVLLIGRKKITGSGSGYQS